MSEKSIVAEATIMTLLEQVDNREAIRRIVLATWARGDAIWRAETNTWLESCGLPATLGTTSRRCMYCGRPAPSRGEPACCDDYGHALSCAIDATLEEANPCR